MVDAVEIELGLPPGKSGWHGRKARIVLLAGEALFLSRRNNAAVFDKGSRAVMVEGGDPSSRMNLVSCYSEHRVDERRDGGTLREINRPPKTSSTSRIGRSHHFLRAPI